MRALRGSSSQFSAWLISSRGEGKRLGRALLSAPGVLAARAWWQRGRCERAHGDLAWHTAPTWTWTGRRPLPMRAGEKKPEWRPTGGAAPAAQHTEMAPCFEPCIVHQAMMQA